MRKLFAGNHLGAMPSLGPLDGQRVHVDERLAADSECRFQPLTLTSLVQALKWESGSSEGQEQ
jgi:hypothetical protein